MAKKSDNTTLLALGALGTAGLVFAGLRSGVLPAPPSLERRLPQVFLPPSRRRGRTLVAYTAVQVPILDKATGRQKVDKNGKPLFIIRSRENTMQLAQAASQALGRDVQPHTIMLAAMIASEAGGMHDLAKVGVAHAALNMVKRSGRSLHAHLTPDDRVGSQFGRYASTRIMPSASEIEIAEGVLNSRYRDPTGGAIQFDSPKAQQQGYNEGWAGYGSPDRLTKKRMDAGLEPIALRGIPESQIRFWRPARQRLPILAASRAA